MVYPLTLDTYFSMPIQNQQQLTLPLRENNAWFQHGQIECGFTNESKDSVAYVLLLTWNVHDEDHND